MLSLWFRLENDGRNLVVITKGEWIVESGFEGHPTAVVNADFWFAWLLFGGCAIWISK